MAKSVPHVQYFQKGFATPRSGLHSRDRPIYPPRWRIEKYNSLLLVLFIFFHQHLTFTCSSQMDERRGHVAASPSVFKTCNLHIRWDCAFSLHQELRKQSSSPTPTSHKSRTLEDQEVGNMWASRLLLETKSRMQRVIFFSSVQRGQFVQKPFKWQWMLRPFWCVALQ